MNHPTSVIVIFSFLILSVGCAFDSGQFSAIDSQKWKVDHTGCDGYRKKSYQRVVGDYEQIKGINEMGLVKLLGKPNETELYDRGQKFYIYHVQCKSDTLLSKRLKIRFNALGLASEIVVITN